MVVYLVCFAAGPGTGWLAHHLGVAASESDINLRQVPHGAGWRSLPLEAPSGVLVDVWEAADEPSAWARRDQLAKQGSRARLCSICNPGNSRGNGRGNYPRKGASKGAKVSLKRKSP
jgi:hypothetical protein